MAYDLLDIHSNCSNRYVLQTDTQATTGIKMWRLLRPQNKLHVHDKDKHVNHIKGHY